MSKHRRTWASIRRAADLVFACRYRRATFLSELADPDTDVDELVGEGIAPQGLYNMQVRTWARLPAPIDATVDDFKRAVRYAAQNPIPNEHDVFA